MSQPIKIRPPSGRAEQLSETLLENAFADGTKVSIEDHRKGISLNSAPGGGDAQALEWLITITNAGLWEYLAAFLSGYAGKEFLKGFSSDAGKDFWRATKFLAASISRSKHLSKREKRLIKISKESGGELTKLSLKLDPQWIATKDQRGLVFDLEDRVLPAIAAYVDRFGADGELSLDFSVSPIIGERSGWEIRATHSGSRREMTIRLFRSGLEWDSRGDGDVEFADQLLFSFFTKGLFPEIERVQIYK